MNEVIQSLLLLSGELKEVKVHLEFLKKSRVEYFKEAWCDSLDVLDILKISKRTLQTLRNSGALPFSRINGKFYYKLADIEKLLEANYSPLKQKSHGTK